MINLHAALVLTHVAAMIGLFSTLTIEGLALRFLRRARTYEQAREWTAAWTLLPAIGAPSILLSLASGIYLATAYGLWSFHWAKVAAPTLVIVAVAGGVVGPRRNRVRAALDGNNGSLPDAVRHQVRHASLSTSWRVRTTLLVALVVDMVIKPIWAIALVVALGLVGIVWSIPRWRHT